MRFALLISVLLHASIVLVLAFGLPLRPPLEVSEQPLLLELVAIGEETTPQAAPKPAPKPEALQDQAPEPVEEAEKPLPPPPASAAAPPPPKLAMAPPPAPPKPLEPPPAPEAVPPAPQAAPPPPLPRMEKKPATPPPPPKLAMAPPPPARKPEAPPEPPPPPDRPKLAQPQTPPVPKVPKAPEESFEKTLDRVALLLDKSKRPPAPPAPETAESRRPAAAPGPSRQSGAGDDRPLTIREIDALKLTIQKQIESCWTVPAGARNAASLVVQVSFSLNPDGSLASQPQVVGGIGGNDPFRQAAAESAVRAVQLCSPLRGLPPESYSYWREITLNFNPRDVLGR